MPDDDSYICYRGKTYDLAALEPDERQVIARLRDFAASGASWIDYQNFYMPEVAKFGESRGLTRRETTRTAAWRIAQDVGGRMMVAAGVARWDDEPGGMRRLIEARYGTIEAFHEAYGLDDESIERLVSPD